eukprot:TRINITY_DN28916_c0_g1_i1.p1 TRINITY_DN28916_c0_g1~~TRINITY_DN28916_c0_g1_i1.p1  ORF type:complete len:358 (-),score=75.26 TRINITY_DN28916_c0_g1_i1:60-1133(-)
MDFKINVLIVALLMNQTLCQLDDVHSLFAVPKGQTEDVSGSLQTEFCVPGVGATRYVSISLDTRPMYLFYAPFAAFFWRRLGWTPVFIYLDVMNDYRPFEISRSYAQKFGCGIEHVLRPSTEQRGYQLQLASMARLFGSCLPGLNASLDMIVSDVDMLPLTNKLFEKRNTSNVAHYFGFIKRDYTAHEIWHDDDFFFNMCHLEATVAAWHDIMQTGPGCDIAGEVISAARRSEKSKEWGFDQAYVLRQIRQWHNRTGLDMDVHRRDYQQLKEMDGRFRPWDEKFYPPGTDFASYATCHCKRPGHWDKEWRAVTRRFLKAFLTSTQMKEFQTYRRQFLRAVEEHFAGIGYPESLYMTM